MAGAAFWQAQSFGTGPGLLPRLASGAVVVLALAGMLSPQRAQAGGSPDVRRAFAVVAAFAAYGVLMPVLGFLTSSVLLAAGFVLGSGGVAAWRWAIGAVAFVVLVYLAFSTIFAVTFPAGMLR